jgi:hypothetical protein
LIFSAQRSVIEAIATPQISLTIGCGHTYIRVGFKPRFSAPCFMLLRRPVRNRCSIFLAHVYTWRPAAGRSIRSTGVGAATFALAAWTWSTVASWAWPWTSLAWADDDATGACGAGSSPQIASAGIDGSRKMGIPRWYR